MPLLEIGVMEVVSTVAEIASEGKANLEEKFPPTTDEFPVVVGIAGAVPSSPGHDQRPGRRHGHRENSSPAEAPHSSLYS